MAKFDFTQLKAPTIDELTVLVQTLSQRITRFLDSRGLLERDAKNSYLTLDYSGKDPMQQLQDHS